MAYENPSGLIAAAVVVQVIVLGMVALRFFARPKAGLMYTTSDWLIGVATVLSTALAILNIQGAAVGILGVPVSSRSGNKSYNSFILRQYQYSSTIVGIVASGLIKISVSFFYLQVFSVQKWRRIILPWIIVLVLWTLGFTLIHLTLCGKYGPPAVAFTRYPELVAQRCGDGHKMGYALVISAPITDLITVLLPVPMVWSLHLDMRQKISLIGIFLIGLLSTGAAIARAYIYIHVVINLAVMDYAFVCTSVMVWILVEVQIGTIAACALTLRPVIHDIVQNGLISQILSSTRSIVSRKSSARSDASTRQESKSFVQDPEKCSQSLTEVVATPGKDEHVAPDAIHVRRDFSVA